MFLSLIEKSEPGLFETFLFGVCEMKRLTAFNRNASGLSQMYYGVYYGTVFEFAPLCMYKT